MIHKTGGYPIRQLRDRIAAIISTQTTQCNDNLSIHNQKHHKLITYHIISYIHIHLPVVYTIMKSSIAAASQRRQTRLRREYLYRKSLQGTEQQLYEKKRLIRNALAQGKALPTEVRATYDKLQTEISQEDLKTAENGGAAAGIDDEYANAGLEDPRICITTSRDPSSRLKQFAKELKLLFPNAARINRGNSRTDDVLQACQQSDCSDLLVVQETRGEPDGLVLCHLPHGPTAFFTITNAVMRHDLPTAAAPMSEAYPQLVLEGFHSNLGKRVATVFKCLFPIPKPDSRRVVTLVNQNDFLSFRHYMYTKSTKKKDDVQLHEVGPRFELKLYQIRLGTISQKEAENEYVLRPYQNTSHKRNVL